VLRYFLNIDSLTAGYAITNITNTLPRHDFKINKRILCRTKFPGSYTHGTLCTALLPFDLTNVVDHTTHLTNLGIFCMRIVHMYANICTHGNNHAYCCCYSCFLITQQIDQTCLWSPLAHSKPSILPICLYTTYPPSVHCLSMRKNNIISLCYAVIL